MRHLANASQIKSLNRWASALGILAGGVLATGQFLYTNCPLRETYTGELEPPRAKTNPVARAEKSGPAANISRFQAQETTKASLKETVQGYSKYWYTYPTTATHSNSVGLMLGQRRR